MNTKVLVEALEQEFGIPGAQLPIETNKERIQPIHSFGHNKIKTEVDTSSQAQKSENTRVAAIMVNDSGRLEGNAIKAGNIIGQVGKISGHIHDPTSTAYDEEKECVVKLKSSEKEMKDDEKLKKELESHKIVKLYPKFP